MILFYGRTQGNSGPDNVNRAVYGHLGTKFLPAGKGGVLRDLKALRGCGTLLVSGLSRRGCLLTWAAKILGKRTVYLLHGCAVWEGEVNGLDNAGPARQERYLLSRCDRIVTVSRSYRDFLALRYPQYGEKLDFWYPGIPALSAGCGREKLPGTIVAAGADRPLKNNRALARAVEELDGAFSLEICGAACHGGAFGELRHSRYLGLLPQPCYWEKLDRTEIFVVNSTRESFGISALEALARGCSLLVSREAGVRELLALEQTDIIEDPLDTEELKAKLLWIHAHPNHSRLSLPGRTWAEAVAELACLCEGGCS